MSDLFGNPEDRFSHDEAHWNKVVLPQGDCLSRCRWNSSKDHDPKFWDRQVWANNANPDQNASKGAVRLRLKEQSDQGVQCFYSIYVIWKYLVLVEPLSLNF